jgi:alpha-L-arabinofuranosidase
MGNISNIYLLVILLSFGHTKALTQTIEVDASNITKSFDHNPAAINLNYLMDDDSYLNPAIGIAESLSNMHVGAVRYPGGEKSDNYLWSVPPYTSANPQFATQGNCNFPNNVPEFSSNFINPLSTTMDFDELMATCLTINAEPLIVVAGDANYCTFCENPPTLEDLITNAVEWIEYANLDKGFDIEYWMVGNESWSKAAYDDPSTALEYANDFVQFSQAMKAVDSSITVVANTKNGTWLNTLLANAEEHVDAIAISNYPVWNWTNGYDTYRNGNPDFVQNITSAVATIGSRDIGVIVSEYNSIDWNHAWGNDNDLGHALVNFQIFGDQIKTEKVLDAYLWNTRWINNANVPHLSDAIDSNGNLNAIGKALSLWGNNLLQNLVFSTNSGFIHSFASADTTGEALNIFLINKDYAIHDVEVNIANFPAISQPLSITQTEFSGNSSTDIAPEITATTPSTATLIDSTIHIPLNPLSVTVIKLKPDLSTEADNFMAQENAPLIYPNPVRDLLTIAYEDFNTNPELSIFNYAGIEVYSETINTPTTKIDFSNLPSGVYILSIANHRSLVAKY